MSDLPARWSRLHHGIEPAAVPFLRPWLQVVWTVAAPIARLRVPPIALTVIGAVLAVDAVLFARAQPWLALGLVALAAVADALDGAVALLANRATRGGALADKAADRVADTAFAAVLWRCGAPWWLAVAAGGLSLLHEAVREVRRGALLARITVAERPTRVVCTLLACGCAGISAATWPPTVCAAVWVAAAVTGLAQLGVTAREPAAPSR